MAGGSENNVGYNLFKRQWNVTLYVYTKGTSILTVFTTIHHLAYLLSWCLSWATFDSQVRGGKKNKKERKINIFRMYASKQ